MKVVCLRDTNKEFTNIDKGKKEQFRIFSKIFNKYLVYVVIGRR